MGGGSNYGVDGKLLGGCCGFNLRERERGEVKSIGGKPFN